MNIVILSFGGGAGHLARAFSIFESFKRNAAEPYLFTIITDSPLDVGDCYKDLEIYQVLIEPEKIFLDDKNTAIYNILKHIDPDLIISDMNWLILRPILDDFKAKKVILFRYVHDEILHIPSVDGLIHSFDPEEYDLAFTIEPSFSIEGCISLHPTINVHPSSNYEEKIIRQVLKVPEDKKLALLAHNGFEGELDTILKEIKIDPEEYCFRSISTFDDEISRQIFPLSHYMSGVDFSIGGCGYNFFYETKAHGIPSLYFPQPRKGNEQHWRLDHNKDYGGPYDGADKMVEMILDLF
ncbi:MULTISPECIES: hypothetical protein [unclassified Oceanispirochaeta]|uniref:hypothetical protein n=1 Tax=unclassified Oceanispirochaeta TaxID=2635722 RepID=UPI000E093351|nr:MULTISPECIES: hypothetical protein [unclassified Oceanispirochaeta]MBF9018320.1 hypothetical protein [Oceanispirochaeta sp. M2]NPD74785.1 hypothetical protein [Oceanispirochaeta sp. M1]RDG29338.1 hypothetical protein DV872_22035 [Oceanispirochaeta sp. M1]